MRCSIPRSRPSPGHQIHSVPIGGRRMEEFVANV
jgi:hypothetical protein